MLLKENNPQYDGVISTKRIIHPTIIIFNLIMNYVDLSEPFLGIFNVMECVQNKLDPAIAFIPHIFVARSNSWKLVFFTFFEFIFPFLSFVICINLLSLR